MSILKPAKAFTALILRSAARWRCVSKDGLWLGPCLLPSFETAAQKAASSG